MKRSVSVLALCLSLVGAHSPVMAQGTVEGVFTDVARTLLAQELDRQAVAEARRVGTLNGWRSYVQQFPNGAHRAEADREIARLGGTVTPPAPATPAPAPVPTPPATSPSVVEAALGLSREQRRQVQVQLGALGHDAGVADGLWGRKTRDAIRSWQTANNATATGYVTERQVRQLREQAGTGTTPAPAPDVAADDRAEEALLGLSVIERREIQRRLTALGYSTGGTDGVLGRNSRTAIATWQRESGARATGYITADQIRELRRQSGG